MDLWTFDQYMVERLSAETDYPDWRKGQVAFNVLCSIRPDLAERVRGTHRDPFNLSSRLPDFDAWLQANWETINGS